MYSTGAKGDHFQGGMVDYYGVLLEKDTQLYGVCKMYEVVCTPVYVWMEYLLAFNIRQFPSLF